MNGHPRNKKGLLLPSVLMLCLGLLHFFSPVLSPCKTKELSKLPTLRRQATVTHKVIETLFSACSRSSHLPFTSIAPLINRYEALGLKKVGGVGKSQEETNTLSRSNQGTTLELVLPKKKKRQRRRRSSR